MRMVVICPEPNQQPYTLIAAAIYEKRVTDQLSNKELARIYAEIIAPPRNEQSKIADEFKFNEITDENGVIHAVCLDCATMVVESSDPEEVGQAELQHECEPS